MSEIDFVDSMQSCARQCANNACACESSSSYLMNAYHHHRPELELARRPRMLAVSPWTDEQNCRCCRCKTTGENKAKRWWCFSFPISKRVVVTRQTCNSKRRSWKILESSQPGSTFDICIQKTISGTASAFFCWFVAPFRESCCRLEPFGNWNQPMHTHTQVSIKLDLVVRTPPISRFGLQLDFEMA